METSMIMKSLIAAAVLAGSTTLVLAQSYPYDGTPDNTLSYGPRAGGAQAAAPVAASPVAADPYNPYDGTPDSTLSYGARPRR
jgi:hypothetical protein